MNRRRPGPTPHVLVVFMPEPAMPPRTWLLVTLGCLAVGSLLPRPTAACSVPVFRYALDRWEADSYAVTVFHRGPLTPALQKLVERLRKAKPANLTLTVIDVAESQPTIWSPDPFIGLPYLSARYPDSVVDDPPAWAAPLSEDSVNVLLDSPLREEIGRRILHGQSAVWVLLECGQSKKDNEAARLIQKHLAQLPKELKLPIPDDAVAEETLADTSRPAPRIEFSLVRLSRASTAERALAAMLLNTEADLKTFDEPIAFAVFGRGRVLDALVGRGINERNVKKQCAELTDACSCEIKRIYPGRDLLMAVDWTKGTGVSAAKETVKVSRSRSAPSVQEPTEPPAEPSSADADGEAPESAKTALQYLLYVLGALAAVTALGAAWISR